MNMATFSPLFSKLKLCEDAPEMASARGSKQSYSSFIRFQVFMFYFSPAQTFLSPQSERSSALPWKDARASFLTFLPTLSQLQSSPFPSQTDIPKAQFPPHCFSNPKPSWFLPFPHEYKQAFHGNLQLNLDISQHSPLNTMCFS